MNSSQVLSSAEGDLTDVIIQALVEQGSRKELRPVLQDAPSKAEAMELLRGYVDVTLPYLNKHPLANALIVAALRWVHWGNVLYRLVEEYELKDEWAIAMLV